MAIIAKNEGMAKKDAIKANLNLPAHQRTLYRWHDFIEQTNSISRKINPGPTKKNRDQKYHSKYSKKVQ